MSSPELPPEDPLPLRLGLPRFQFSLWALLVAITVVAVLLGVWSIVGTAVTWVMAIFVYVVLPVPLLVAAIFSRGDVQAFSIGGLMPWISNHLVGFPIAYAISQNQWQSPLAPIFMAFVVIGISVVCGFVGAYTRRRLEQRGWTRY